MSTTWIYSKIVFEPHLIFQNSPLWPGKSKLTEVSQTQNEESTERKKDSVTRDPKKFLKPTPTKEIAYYATKSEKIPKIKSNLKEEMKETKKIIDVQLYKENLQCF